MAVYSSTGMRFTDKTVIPASEQISDFLGRDAVNRLANLESFLKGNYEITRELKFPFGNNYGWGYKYSCKNKLLCYVFFEKGSFTITITIGKDELDRLHQELEAMLPKTKELWENRYPCGDGGWMHYRLENDNELADIEKLISIKKKPKQKQHA